MSDIAWTTGTLRSDGETIYYEVSGDAENAVVFCHGLGGNHAVWYQQVPLFAQRYRVITWDQRGFGLSTNENGKSEPRVSARDLRSLLDHLGLERVHLVGQSMGGWVALGFALEAAERLRALVITDSPAGVYTDVVVRILAGSRHVDTREVIGRHPAIGTRLSREDRTKAFLYQQIGGFRSGVDDQDTIMRRVGSTSYDLEAVRALRVPTLLVVGTDDQLIPPAVVREIAGVIDGAHVVEIDGAGHSPYFEQPGAWNEAVLEFLSKH